MPKKKILVIYTGGTFGMQSDTGQRHSSKVGTSKLKIPKLTSIQLKKSLLNGVPEMADIASCDVKVLYNIDSCQMQPYHWFELADVISKAGKTFDGAVILHGTDTLAYTASALSMLLSPSPMPVVITGAQQPLALIRNDARQNLLSAIEVASHAPSVLSDRIMVLFHDELFLGSRVRKKSARQYKAFESPRFPVLATIGTEIVFHDSIQHLPKLKGPSILKSFKPSDRPLPTLLNFSVAPGFQSSFFSDTLLDELDALILTLYPSGTAPTDRPDFIDFLKRAKEQECPIIGLTEREGTGQPIDRYAAGSVLLKNGLIFSPDLTPEAAWVKLWLLRELNSKMNRSQFYTWLIRNWKNSISDETVCIR